MKILVLLSAGLMLTLAENSAILQEFIAGNQRFATKLYKEVQKSIDGNFLINPLSLQMILSLALIGATSEDASEIISTLQIPRVSNDDTLQLFKGIIADLENTGQSTMATANKIFVKKGLQINDEMKVAAVDNFNSKIEEINFLDKSSISKINSWVATNTFDQTPMVSLDSFNAKTKSLFANLQYFRGFWQKGFPTRATKPGTFYVSENERKQVPLMEVSTSFKYAYNESLRAQFIEMPYQDSSFSMTIILPDDKFGLDRLEERVEEIFYDQVYYGPKVRLVVPTFSIKSTVTLEDALRNLGMQQVLDEENGDTDRFEITNVYQKTIMDVDEEGRAVVARRGKILGTPPWVEILIDFIADHPFMFYLKSQNSGVIFIGRYVSP